VPPLQSPEGKTSGMHAAVLALVTVAALTRRRRHRG
jgi:MYXO-CTERM domain-containing protein